MDCNELVELVTAYLDGALDPDTTRRFDEHLQICEGCDVYLDQFRETIETVGELRPEHLSGPARQTLLAAFRTWHTPS